MDLPELLQKLDRKLKGSASIVYLFMTLIMPVVSIMLGRDVNALFYVLGLPSLWFW